MFTSARIAEMNKEQYAGIKQKKLLEDQISYWQSITLNIYIPLLLPNENIWDCGCLLQNISEVENEIINGPGGRVNIVTPYSL